MFSMASVKKVRNYSTGTKRTASVLCCTTDGVKCTVRSLFRELKCTVPYSTCTDLEPHCAVSFSECTVYVLKCTDNVVYQKRLSSILSRRLRLISADHDDGYDWLL